MQKSRTSLFVIGIILAMLAASLLTVLIMYLSGVVSTERTELEFTVTAIAAKEYDGQPLRATSYDLNEGELKEGHRLEVKILGEQTDCGTSESDLEVRIFDKENREVTNEYSIKVNRGNLTVLRKPITVCILPQKVPYSGKNIPIESYVIYKGVGLEGVADELTVGKLVDGHKLVISFPGRFENVGDKLPDPAEWSSSNFKIYDAAGKNVSANYQMETASTTGGTVEIVPRKLKVRALDVEKYYDGKPVEGQFELYSGTLVEGHFIGSVEYEDANGKKVTVKDAGDSKQVRVGKITVYKQTGYDFAPLDEDEEKNYELDLSEAVFATHSVKKRTVTVAARDLVKMYDGEGVSNLLRSGEEPFTVTVEGYNNLSAFSAAGYTLTADNLDDIKNKTNVCNEIYSLNNVRIMQGTENVSGQFIINVIPAAVIIHARHISASLKNLTGGDAMTYTGQELEISASDAIDNFESVIVTYMTENSISPSSVLGVALSGLNNNDFQVVCNKIIRDADEYTYNFSLSTAGQNKFGAGNVVFEFSSGRLEVKKAEISVTYNGEAENVSIEKVYDGKEAEFDVRKFAVVGEGNFSVTAADFMYINRDEAGNETADYENHALVKGEFEIKQSPYSAELWEEKLVVSAYTVKANNIHIMNHDLAEDVTKNYIITAPEFSVKITPRKIYAVAGTPNVVCLVDSASVTVEEYIVEHLAEMRAAISFENLATGDSVTRNQTAGFEEFDVSGTEMGVSASLPTRLEMIEGKRVTRATPCIYNSDNENVTFCYELVNDGEPLFTVQLQVK